MTIIGGSGFLGKSIIDYAQKKGLSKWQINKIICISRRKIYLKKRNSFKVKYITGDISKLKKLYPADYIMYAVNSDSGKKNLSAIKAYDESKILLDQTVEKLQKNSVDYHFNEIKRTRILSRVNLLFIIIIK